MIQEFWVVGGSYRDANFADLHEGSGELYGPFACYDDALTSWRERTATTRSQATVRFSVVVTAPRRTGHAA
jgi:hypothetical protein